MHKALETGELVTIIKKDMRIDFIKPCSLEKGKKMAKAMLKSRITKEMFRSLEKAEGFDEINYFPKLGLARLKKDKKIVIIIESGEISIRTAESEKDILDTLDKIIKILKGEDG
jgi:ArsR family metal-binding transcriptional regulator